MRANLCVSSTSSSRRRQSGITIIEAVIAIAVVAVLSAFAMFTYGDFQENSDAASIDAMHSSLQSVISQASARMDVNPTTLDQNAVVRAVRTDGKTAGTESIEITATGGNNYSVVIGNSARSARLTVSDSGAVAITSLSGFTNYGISGDGTITKL